ncbi:MAG: DUF6364 family protein [Hydrogenothermaceae bacterium]|nr:DUF6364 family protein [Hydrogenothermaceae bacterium]
MRTLLKIELEEELLEKLKRVSAEKRCSVEQLIEYILEDIYKKDELTPKVKRLKGILKGKEVKDRDYKNYLEEKYC